MEKRRLEHRDVAVLDREQQLVMLDHLLHEDAFDRFVAGAYVAGAEAMEGQERNDERDRDDCRGRWNFNGHQ